MMIWWLRPLMADAHSLYDLGVEIQLTLGQADRGRADCTANLQCQMTCTAACASTTEQRSWGCMVSLQLMRSLDRRIAGGVRRRWCNPVKANIIINGARNRRCKDTLAGKMPQCTTCGMYHRRRGRSDRQCRVTGGCHHSPRNLLRIKHLLAASGRYSAGGAALALIIHCWAPISMMSPR